MEIKFPKAGSFDEDLLSHPGDLIMSLDTGKGSKVQVSLSSSRMKRKMFRLHLETVRVRDDRHAHPHVHAADGVFVCVKPHSLHTTRITTGMPRHVPGEPGGSR